MSYSFKQIALQDWRQFGETTVPLDRQVTVLTGSNGCGKTTILNILSRHFGWALEMVSTPYFSKTKQEQVWSDFQRQLEEQQEVSDPLRTVGHIQYDDGSTCTLHAPTEVSNNPRYSLTYRNQKPVVGLHIPSHRPSITYQKIDRVPINPKDAQAHYEEFRQLLFQTYGSENVRNPGRVLKESLISLAVFGQGNESVASNRQYEELFAGFQDVLREVLPPELGFQRLQIRVPDVVLICSAGDFSLDAMSGGVSSLFGIAWQIFMFGSEKGACTVVFDEPENHLHPSMQRSLLPSLARAFPAHRFVVATHSPFVVTSHREANVIGLSFGDNHQITAEVLDDADLAGSPNTVLKEILDVPTTLPLWVERRIKEILERYEDDESPDKGRKIFEELKRAGLNTALGELHLDDDAT